MIRNSKLSNKFYFLKYNCVFNYIYFLAKKKKKNTNKIQSTWILIRIFDIFFHLIDEGCFSNFELKIYLYILFL